jgi:hypothetical protein
MLNAMKFDDFRNFVLLTSPSISHCMRKLLLFLLILGSLSTIAQDSLRESPVVFIKSKTIISSNAAIDGQEFQFEVTRDVYANGELIIEAGAKAYGNVIFVNKSKFVGEPGLIEIEMSIVEGVEKDYAISGPILFSQGKSRKTASCLLSALVTPLFLLIKGQPAHIYPYTEIEVELTEFSKPSRSN